jgi:hypothetical protein
MYLFFKVLLSPSIFLRAVSCRYSEVLSPSTACKPMELTKNFDEIMLVICGMFCPLYQVDF